MEELVGKGADFVRGIGRDHGTNTMILVFVLIMTFALGGFLGWFVGRDIYKSVESNTSAIKALVTVVDGLREELRPPVQPRWPVYPQQRFSPQQAPPQEYRDDRRETGR